MSNKNLRKPAPASTKPAPVAEKPAPAKARVPEMTDAEACGAAIQLLNYAADAGAFAGNPKLWGPKGEVIDRLARLAVRLDVPTTPKRKAKP